jgi:hypothetical protein
MGRMTADARIDRLIAHVRRGWAPVRTDPELRARAVAWLEAHPAGWPAVQELWLQALRGRGALCDWLERGAEPGSWDGDVPLHSVLTSHPFACLPRWSTPRTSIGS